MAASIESFASSDMVSTRPSGSLATSSEYWPTLSLRLDLSDNRSRTKQHVALKVLTADSYGNGHDTFELDILRHIRAIVTSHLGANHVLGLLNEFEHRGPNGNHMCLVVKPMGPEMTKYRRLFPKARIPLPMVKKIATQLLLALDFLHDKCRVIHTGEYHT